MLLLRRLRARRPLQWAVQNKHDACVQALMELYPESSQMNVLDKNGFGKSAVTDVRTKFDFLLAWRWTRVSMASFLPCSRGCRCLGVVYRRACPLYPESGKP